LTAATYRIGPSDFFTSADLLADAKTLNGQINALNNANWDRPSQALFDGFQGFLSEWRGFYSDTFGGLFNFSALNNSNRDQLIQYESRFNTFAAEYASQTGNALPGGVIAPSTGTKDTFADHFKAQLQPLIPQFDIGNVLIVVGLVAAGAVVYFFRAPLGRALGKGAA